MLTQKHENKRKCKYKLYLKALKREVHTAADWLFKPALSK